MEVRALMASVTGRTLVSASIQSTSTRRSSWMNCRPRLRHSRWWMETPRPRVITPTTGSPKTGLQHFAKRISMLSMPPMVTTCRGPALAAGAAALCACLSAGAAPGVSASGAKRRCSTSRRAMRPNPSAA